MGISLMVSSCNLIVNKVAINFYVLGSFMEGWVRGDVNGDLIVAKQKSWHWILDTKVLK